MRLIEKQRQQRFVGIASLWQLLEQLSQQPQQERCIDFRRLVHQTAGVEQMNAPLPLGSRLQNVFELQCRFAKQGFGALLLKDRQAAQQRLTGTGGHQRRVFAQQLRIVLEMIEQRLQIFQIQQQQALAISDLEGCVKRRLLAVSQFQQAADQQRAHFTQGGAQRMTGLTVDIPQGHRIRLRLVVEPWHPGDTLGHFALRVAGRTETTQIALDVSGKYRDPGVTERLGQTLQGDGFTGTGGASDQSVAVRQAHGLSNLLACEIGADYELRGVRHFVTQWLIFDYAWPIQRSERPDHKSGRTFP
ncbi:hypothetical protein EMIT0P395_140019 [Pseudomonas sp. IT-P395]